MRLPPLTVLCAALTAVAPRRVGGEGRIKDASTLSAYALLRMHRRLEG